MLILVLALLFAFVSVKKHYKAWNERVNGEELRGEYECLTPNFSQCAVGGSQLRKHCGAASRTRWRRTVMSRFEALALFSEKAAAH